MNNVTPLIEAAIAHANNHPALRNMTLNAAYRQHGQYETRKGSWIEGMTQDEIEDMLLSLPWAVDVDNDAVLIAHSLIPEDVTACESVIPMDEAKPEQKVRIDLSEPSHPAAVAVETSCKGVSTSIINIIIEKDGANDPDVAQFGHGPVLATWYPGRQTPKSEPDGVLKDGDIVTASEAFLHGFRTLKF